MAHCKLLKLRYWTQIWGEMHIVGPHKQVQGSSCIFRCLLDEFINPLSTRGGHRSIILSPFSNIVSQPPPSAICPLYPCLSLPLLRESTEVICQYSTKFLPVHIQLSTSASTLTVFLPFSEEELVLPWSWILYSGAHLLNSLYSPRDLIPFLFPFFLFSI